jgi:hypothetical protein
MNEKKLGNYLLISAALLVLISASAKIYFFTKASLGYGPFVMLWFIAGLMAAAGFIMRSSELERHIGESQLKVSKELKEAKEKERKKETFTKFLEKYSDKERQVIEFLHTYEGSTVDSVRRNFDFTVDKIITRLEDEKVVEVLPSGKIYLKKLS